MALSSSSLIAPTAFAPTASKTDVMSSARPSRCPGRMVPPYRKTLGTLTRAAAMSIPGRDLSHPAKVTMASKRSACMTVSTESAMTSRETSEACMPSCPIEIPSETAIVTNSNGRPPPSRTATLARLASRSRGKLHGVTSFQLDATPIWGLVMSSSLRPIARNMALAGARPLPIVTSELRGVG